MKAFSFNRALLTVIFIAFSFCTFGQEAPKGELYLVHEDKVKPEMVGNYEQAAKGLADAMAKYAKGSIKYWVASREDFSYIYVIPVGNYAGIDKVENTFGELNKAMGKEAMDAMMSKYDGTFSSHRDFMVRYRADLSYKPDFSADQTFRHWDFYYIDPAKEGEAIAISKEWKALFEKKKLPAGYRLNIADLGLESAIIVVQAAKSVADYYAQSAEMDKMLGQEGMDLMKKTWSIVTHFDQHNGRLHPDLSYMPMPSTKK